MRQILLHKEGKETWCADPRWLPGSPTVGRGKTKLEALIKLLYVLGLEIDIEDENTKESEG